MKLDKKTILITGGSKGIGRATAICFAQAGAHVIINYHSDEKGATETLEECNKYSAQNMIFKADVSDEKEISNMMDVISKKYQTIDMLVNNAGIFDENDNPTNIEAFQNIFNNNFLSTVMVTKHVLPLMKKGKIINISSIHGRIGHGTPQSIAYSAMKAAINSYTKNIAKELAPEILVNAVAPGRVATPLWGNPNEDEQSELGKIHATKRMIQPEEIADAILFLARNDSMCGEILTIDAGMSLITLG